MPFLIGGKMDLSKAYTFKKQDEIYTPSYAVPKLYKHMKKDKELIIWECAETPKKNGKIGTFFEKKNAKVIRTCIHEGADFLSTELPLGTTHIITNPPFSMKNDFLKRCFEFTKQGVEFALLLPLAALETKERTELYKNYGFSVLMFDTRVEFEGSNGSPPFASIWLCSPNFFGAEKANQIIFDTLDKPKKEKNRSNVLKKKGEFK